MIKAIGCLGEWKKSINDYHRQSFSKDQGRRAGTDVTVGDCSVIIQRPRPRIRHEHYTTRPSLDGTASSATDLKLSGYKLALCVCNSFTIWNTTIMIISYQCPHVAYKKVQITLNWFIRSSFINSFLALTYTVALLFSRPMVSYQV